MKAEPMQVDETDYEDVVVLSVHGMLAYRLNVSSIGQFEADGQNTGGGRLLTFDGMWCRIVGVVGEWSTNIARSGR